MNKFSLQAVVIGMLLLVNVQSIYAQKITIDLDLTPASGWGAYKIYIADVPAANATNAGTRDVIVDRVLYGPPVPTGREKIYFDPEAPNLPTGTYILLLEIDADKDYFGLMNLQLGDIINYYPLKSPQNPAVDDMQMIILTAMQNPVALKLEMLYSLSYNASQHPLIVQYLIIAHAHIAAQIIEDARKRLHEILMNPQKYNPMLVLTADIQYSNEYSRPSEENFQVLWQYSDQRKQLYADLDKRIAKDDYIRPRFDIMLVECRKEWDQHNNSGSENHK